MTLLRTRRLVPALALLLTPLALAGCRGSREIAGAARGNPIVVISIDTLRSDRLPIYGYRQVETPALDALAADGVVFEHAYSHVPLTLPSHAALLTGQLPGDVGVRDNLGYRVDAAKHPWLPRLLKQAGYATGAAVSAYVLRAETGMAADFDFYEATIDLRAAATIGASQRSCGETLRRAGGWLDEVKSQPFFFLYHLYEPHTPYEPPAPLAERYKNRPYEGEIAAADACVGELVARLERDGLYDRATVVVLSDHGESLGEHGEQEHGILLHRSVLQVPLVVKLPGGRRAGERVATPAALVDLLPTLTELAGVATPAGIAGESLFAGRTADAPRAIFSETFYPRLHLGWSELSSVIEFPFHLIHGPDPELYDLAQDPGELDNLRERERRTFATLRERARGFERELVAPAAEDAETAANLAALGYLGGAALTVDGPLADPKSKIGTLRDYGRAIKAIVDQDYPLAATLCQALTVENPYMVDAWENLGIALHRLGRSPEALAALERAMTLSGGTAHIAIATGHVLLDLGRLDDAAKHAELALASSPSATRTLLAQVAIARGDLDDAEREARLALEARGARIGPIVVLAQVLRDRDRLGEALALTDDALREQTEFGADAKHPGLFFTRGDLFARLGQAEDAELAFQKEIELFPADARSYTRLAALYVALGYNDRASATLGRLVQRNIGSPAAWGEAIKTLRVLGDPGGASRVLAQALERFPGEASLVALR
jgi:arylsulfatase A-like enzyme/Flp pilus assembly protein TadD